MNGLAFRLHLAAHTVRSKFKRLPVTVALLTSDRFAGRPLREDQLLLFALARLGVGAEIVSWRSQRDWARYRAVVFRSTWGYYDRLDEFHAFLDTLEAAGVTVINSLDLIRGTLSKQDQYEALEKAGLPRVESRFFASLAALDAAVRQAPGPQVVKPVVSASAAHTYRADRLTATERAQLQGLLDQGNRLILQDFIPAVEEGEVSLVFTGGEFSHAVRRFNHVFSGGGHEAQPCQAGEELVALGRRVAALYPDAVYARVDTVRHQGRDLVLEVELVEPDLFFVLLPGVKLVGRFAQAIKAKL
jgi:glutathione synthase/RimK-type ligase-like ATP-grasp enzyme